MATIRHVRLTDKDGSSQILDVAGGEAVPSHINGISYIDNQVGDEYRLYWDGFALPWGHKWIATWVGANPGTPSGVYVPYPSGMFSYSPLVFLTGNQSNTAENDGDPVTCYSCSKDGCRVRSGDTKQELFCILAIGIRPFKYPISSCICRCKQHRRNGHDRLYRPV